LNIGVPENSICKGIINQIIIGLKVNSLFQVKHAGLLMRSNLKSVIFNSIHLWGILPTAEEQATMSQADVVAFIAAAVGQLRQNRGFADYGLNINISCLTF
jgi:hypothetical protein